MQAVASTVSRWWAGRFGDRHGPAVLLVPGVVATAAGILALVMVDRPVAVVAGMALFGAGFGVTQNASMTVMLDRVAPSGFGTVSAIWNLAYDAGIGAGAFGFGVVAARTGYPAAFALTAALVLALAADRSARSTGSLGCIQRATSEADAWPLAGLLYTTCMSSAAEKAYEAIRDGIVGGVLPVGGRLREEELAGSIGVSRTPVREALRRLDAEGLVEFSPRRGAQVASWSDQDLDEIFGLRAVLESYGASLAATRIGGDALAELAELADGDGAGQRPRPARRGGRAQQPLPRPASWRRRATSAWSACCRAWWWCRWSGGPSTATRPRPWPAATPTTGSCWPPWPPATPSGRPR